jgi:YD repeat-containing protein
MNLPYDAAGNQLQNTTGLTYTYDASGRMNAVYQAGTQKVAMILFPGDTPVNSSAYAWLMTIGAV